MSGNEWSDDEWFTQLDESNNVSNNAVCEHKDSVNNTLKTETVAVCEDSVENTSANSTGDHNVENTSANSTGEHNVQNTSANSTGEQHVETTSANSAGEHNVENTSANSTGEHNVETTSANRTGDHSVETMSANSAGEHNVENTSSNSTGEHNVETMSANSTGEHNVENTAANRTGEHNVENSSANSTGEHSVETMSTNSAGEHNVENTSSNSTGEHNVENTSANSTGEHNVENMSANSTCEHNVENLSANSTGEHNAENASAKETAAVSVNISTGEHGVENTSANGTADVCDDIINGENEHSIKNMSTKETDTVSDSRNVAGKRLRPRRNLIKNKHESSSDSEDIPLKRLATKLHKPSSKLIDSDDADDFIITKDMLDSSDSDLSDLGIPIIEITKHRKKWFRKRVRPLKREQSVKKRKTRLPKITTKPRVNVAQQIHEAKQQSKREQKLYQILHKSHKSRLDNLLQSNNMRQKHTQSDGDCFFNAVSLQLHGKMSATELRKATCKHLTEHKSHYIDYLIGANTLTNETSDKYTTQVSELQNDGTWNNDMADIVPLATAYILQITIQIYTSVLNKPITHGSFEGTDLRGRHSPGNKTHNSTFTHIKSHIDSFPAMESHYTRKGSHRKFLGQDLSIVKMYDLYKLKCNEDGMTPASKITYRRIFCNEYNYSFHKPKKDCCDTCNAYNEKEKADMLTPTDREIQQRHLQSKDRAREEKEKDKQTSKNDKSVFTATFDLEAVLYTPCSNVSQIFYKRKLLCYNLSVYDLATKDGTFYLWDETEGARGSSEIGSCLIAHLEGLPPAIKHVVLYSDCCTGQNRNQYVAAGLLHAVKKSNHIDTIEQKFLESGHTHMECDSMHSAIEHAKRSTSIFIPSQWDTVVHMARRKTPYIVIPMRFNQFYDLQHVANEDFGNIKVDIDGNKVNWMKIKVLRFQKNAENEIQFKYRYDDEFKIINASKRIKRGRQQNTDPTNLTCKYNSKRLISADKKKDLLSLCQAMVIPPIYHPFYEALATSKTVKDRLPDPDLLEEDVDSD